MSFAHSVTKSVAGDLFTTKRDVIKSVAGNDDYELSSAVAIPGQNSIRWQGDIGMGKGHQRSGWRIS